jgi:hypothetical protein
MKDFQEQASSLSEILCCPSNLIPYPYLTFFLSWGPNLDPHLDIFFLVTCQQAHHLQPEKFNDLLKFRAEIIFQALFQSAQHIYEKREGYGSVSDPDPYLCLKDRDPDPGGPKTCGSGSRTLLCVKVTNIYWTATIRYLMRTICIVL